MVELVEDAVQLHDVNVHWLELEMVAGEDSMWKAKPMKLAEVYVIQLHEENAHWLELAMVAEEEDIKKA